MQAHPSSPTGRSHKSAHRMAQRLCAASVALALLAVLPTWAQAPQKRTALTTTALTPLPPNWQPIAITTNFSGGKAIELRDAKIDVQVFGEQAQTRIELRLFNPNARVLEGELQFPLLDGQVVTGFALDVGGAMRDAVPVPKAKGQEIFEDIRRRRVDPGLLEATAGNQYKLRVYPIPAQGERRVTLTVMETLQHGGDGGLALRVPLMFASQVEHLHAQIKVPGIARTDATLLQEPGDVDMAWADDGLTLNVDKSAWSAPNGPMAWLQLALRQAAKPQVMVGESNGKRYFAGQFAVEDQLQRRETPRHIALVWDASGSAATQARVLPLLAAYFNSLQQPVKVSLLVVRNRPEPVRTLTVQPGGFENLATLLRAEPLDGSSNFDVLPIPPDANLTIMVTDGLMTDGQRLINYTHTAPVFVLNGSQTADMPRLRRLTDRSNGALIDATQAPPEQALQAMQWQGLQVVGVTSLDAKQLAMPTTHVQHGRIAIAGEMLDKTAQLQVTLADAKGRQRKLTLNVQGSAASTRWPAQQWAAWRGAELAENPTLHSTELARITAMQGIVGPNSSLIVLEQASDYARYELPAPPELAKEVAQLREQQVAQNTLTSRQHVESMVRQLDEKQTWWNKNFPKTNPAASVSRVDKPEATGGASIAYAPRAAAPALAKAPMPAAAPAAAAPPPPPAPVPVAPSALKMEAQAPRQLVELQRAAPEPATAERKAAGSVTANAVADRLAPDSLKLGGLSKAKAATQPANATITLQAWSANAPYLARLKASSKEDMYRIYLDERTEQQNSSAFYMDAAGLFFERGMPELGLRILSNLAEMNLENRQLLRMYAYRLTQARRSDLAVPVFERVKTLAPNEPQSWRDLGLALADSGQPQLAVNALWEVVSHPWNGRFSDIGMIALAELNAIDAQNTAKHGPALDMSQVDKRLRRNMPLGLRVVMAWDTDDTDVDLWVTDPNGERASYANRLTYQGGAMSHDATGGYGPEEFSLKTAKPGKYVVEAQFFGNRQQVLSAGTTVMLRITTGFGTPAAQDKWLNVRLTSGKEVARIGEVEVK